MSPSRGRKGSGKENLEKKPKRRAKTISARRLTREEIKFRDEVMSKFKYRRPKSRAECRKGARPCPFVSCQYHLYLDVNPVTGSVKLNFPHLEVWELEETCALDIAESGGLTLEEVGEIMNLTRERVRQVERDALGKLKDTGHLESLKEHFDD